MRFVGRGKRCEKFRAAGRKFMAVQFVGVVHPMGAEAAGYGYQDLD